MSWELVVFVLAVAGWADVVWRVHRWYALWIRHPFDGRGWLLRKLGARRRRRASRSGLGPHYLYRYWSRPLCRGELLYVGITSRHPLIRALEHFREARKGWIRQRAMSMSWDIYPTRDAVEEAERNAIRTENPRHNKIRYR